jgi:hypothetical protein
MLLAFPDVVDIFVVVFFKIMLTKSLLKKLEGRPTLVLKGLHLIIVFLSL